MTRKVAKDVLKSLDYYLQNRFEDYGERNHDAMMIAIKALEQYPRFRACVNCGNAGEDAFACYECEDYSNFEAKSKEKVGHWTHNKCDKCGASRPPLFDNYCPNCGTKMESEE